MTWRRRGVPVVLAAVVALLWASLPAAQAAVKVVDFEGLPEGAVGDPYAKEGVQFPGQTLVYANTAYPRFGTRALRPGPDTCEGPDDPPCRPIIASFNPPASRVKVSVGYLDCPDAKVSVVVTPLDAKGADGPPVSAQVAAGGTEEKQIEVAAPVITGVRIAATAAFCPYKMRPLVVDKVEFSVPDPVVPPAPKRVATVVPSPAQFGSAVEGERGEFRDIKVTSSGTDRLAFNGTTLSGDSADFPVEKAEQNDCRQSPSLAPGAWCNVRIRFAPTKVGGRAAVLEIDLDADAESPRVSLSGTGLAKGTDVREGRATLSPASLDFGKVTRGTSVSKDIKVANAGPGDLLVDAVRVAPEGEFTSTAGGCPTPLAPGEACSIAVQFTPTEPGLRTATLTVTTGASQTDHTVPLLGSTVDAGPAATLTPGSVYLATSPSGPSGSVKVTSTGTAPVVLGTASVSGHVGDFTVSTQCDNKTLRPGDTCDVPVTFNPTQSGERLATVRIPAGALTLEAELRGAAQGVLPGTPTLAVEPGETVAGVEVNLSGGGFGGPSGVYWDGRDGRFLTTAWPASSGAISLAVQVPKEARVGPHVFVACDPGGRCARADFRVLAAATSIVCRTNCSGDRGRPWLVPAVLIGVLLAGGLAARQVRRRLPAGPRGRHRPPGPPSSAVPLRPGGGDERPVHTGFAPADDCTVSLDPSEALEPDRNYHFWIELGAAEPSVATARITVALFDYDGEFVLGAGAVQGGFDIDPDGEVTVARRGGFHDGARSDDKVLHRRLFFPVRTPVAPGRHRLRCSLYVRQVLVQSLVVSADVRPSRVTDGMHRTPAAADPQHAERDFVLSRRLDPDHLAGFAPHQLSLLLNSDTDDDHSIRILGDNEFQDSVRISEHQLVTWGQLARRALRKVSSGTAEESATPGPYRYAGPPDIDRLAADLVVLARAGWMIYSSIATRLGTRAPGSDDLSPLDRLAELVRGRARIQFAYKEGAQQSLPLAMLYDLPLDDQAGDLSLCPTFASAYRAGEPLDATECFADVCPDQSAPRIVCPSGFWGFRHVLGVTVTRGDGGDVPLRFGAADRLVAAGVSTDLEQWQDHERALRQLDRGTAWRTADTRDGVLELLHESQPSLVYLYCHGGINRGVAYLRLGRPDEDGFTGSLLPSYRVRWPRSHPLVFINGCNTGTVGPETPLDLVTAFVDHALAAGVIGTEVTVYEPLACSFAELLLGDVLAGGAPVGEAVLRARLALLASGNPLGLAYVAYASSELAMGPAGVPAGATR
ncbi:MAG: choice-of-anchor D domain-containing protein [Acidimicrobiales bacterium]